MRVISRRGFFTDCLATAVTTALPGIAGERVWFLGTDVGRMANTAAGVRDAVNATLQRTYESLPHMSERLRKWRPLLPSGSIDYMRLREECAKLERKIEKRYGPGDTRSQAEYARAAAWHADNRQATVDRLRFEEFLRNGGGTA